MKKNPFKRLLGAASAGLATAMAMASPAAAATNVAQHAKEVKAVTSEAKARHRHEVRSLGGHPLVTTSVPGLTPKQYGILYGHGNRSNKTNHLRLSHDAKLKRS